MSILVVISQSFAGMTVGILSFMMKNIPTVMCEFMRYLKSLSPLFAACQMEKPAIIARAGGQMMSGKVFLIYVYFEK